MKRPRPCLLAQNLGIPEVWDFRARLGLLAFSTRYSPSTLRSYFSLSSAIHSEWKCWLRQTVYNHFPDELSLLKACSAHNRTLNPPPDPEPWRLIADPEVRLRRALAEVYGYFRRNEQMIANVSRDAQANPNVAKVFEARVKHQERMRDALAGGWEEEQGGAGQRCHNKRLYGALWMALEFQTWRALVRQQGLADDEVIELMVGMVRCLMRS